MPPDRPPTLIHGDLLGQNILLRPEMSPAVIDWEFTQLGDPAYDLAIVTRGAKRPFQIDRGLDLLLDSYRQAGGRDVERRHVLFHELCLAADWLKVALTGGHGVEHPDQAVIRLRNVLQRALAVG